MVSKTSKKKKVAKKSTGQRIKVIRNGEKKGAEPAFNADMEAMKKEVEGAFNTDNSAPSPAAKKPVAVKGRVPTGIQGLDELIAGGFPLNYVILLSGGPGSGKTIFGMHYVYNGAKMFDEPGMYISFEQEPEQIINEMKGAFGWKDIDKLITKQKLFVQRMDIYDFDKFMSTIEDMVDRYKIKRLVIDPISFLGMWFDNDLKLRKAFLELDKRLAKMRDCTALLVSEIPVGSENKVSSFGVEEFCADGIVVLHYSKEGNMYTRALSIMKMRATKHDTGVHPFEITPQGLVVYPTESVFGGF